MKFDSTISAKLFVMVQVDYRGRVSTSLVQCIMKATCSFAHWHFQLITKPVSACAAVQHERGPRRLRKFCSPGVTADKSSMCSSVSSSSSSVLPIRPCPQSAAAAGCERPMDLRVAAATSTTVVEAARTAMLRHSSTVPLTTSGTLGPYDVR